MMQDEAIVLAARDRIAALNIPNLTVVADTGQPTQDAKLPHCDVFIGMDDAVVDGAPRTGPAGYIHKITLAIEVTAKGNSQRAVRAWLAAAGEAIFGTLLSSFDWATIGGKPIIEAFGDIRRGYQSPPDGNHCLTKLQIEIQVMTRTSWPALADGLPDFTTFAATFDTGSGDDEPPIGITIDVPTE